MRFASHRNGYISDPPAPEQNICCAFRDLLTLPNTSASESANMENEGLGVNHASCRASSGGMQLSSSRANRLQSAPYSRAGLISAASTVHTRVCWTDSRNAASGAAPSASFGSTIHDVRIADLRYPIATEGEHDLVCVLRAPRTRMCKRSDSHRNSCGIGACEPR